MARPFMLYNFEILLNTEQKNFSKVNYRYIFKTNQYTENNQRYYKIGRKEITNIFFKYY